LGAEDLLADVTTDNFEVQRILSLASTGEKGTYLAIATYRLSGMHWCSLTCCLPASPTVSFALRLALLLGLDPEQLTPGKMTYHLRRLRLHGLIDPIPHTHRYRLTTFGIRVALFFTRIYDHLLRPGLGAILPTLSRPAGSLRRDFDRVDLEVNAWIQHASIAA
jgi:hypothetical protein